MSLTISWEQIALRLLLACAASLIVGLNRDEQGHPAGMRTTVLVCMAATLAMLQVSILLPTSGKEANSFVVMDLMRLPLGILSGIGFIGAGVILKHERRVTGVTTAATMWFVTVLGLLFGGGQLLLGVVGTVLAITVLWGLKRVEGYIPREHHGTLHLVMSDEAPAEDELRHMLDKAGCSITRWKPTYEPPNVLHFLDCELRWREPAARIPHTPLGVLKLREMPGMLSVTWEE